jgi:DNA-directed RNA polymerase subunit E'/Rpb7
MDNIYFNCVLTKKIIVASKFLNENIDEYIENYLKSKVEGLCIDEGYIKNDSIKILKKSIGMLLGSKFTGDITYDIAYTADICNPVIGNLIDCKVKFINKLGILGNNGPITIIVGKQFHANDDDINNIKENDIVKVEVIAKKFSLNDREIKVIAKLWTDNEKNDKSKKDFISSDLTPIIADNEFPDIENNDINEYDSEEPDEFSIDDDDEYDEDIEDDDFIEDDEDNDIKLENPDENNLDAEDIELDDEEDEEEDEEEEYDEND